MEHEYLAELQTPCIVIDMIKTRKNIKEMQAIADENHCRLRPHIKTHKMKLFANLQLEYGAAGITCAKVSEAEIMADGGAEDIFIAYPMVGAFRIKRAVALSKKIKRLILAVDSLECADALNTAAMEAGITIEIRLEIDTGAKRTGVMREHSVELAVAVSKLSNLNLTGIYTFKSLIYKNEATLDKHIAGIEEGELMNKLAEDIRKTGVNITDISAGSTPTGEEVAKTGLVNEIRPGTYIFKDFMLCNEGAARIEDISVRIYATVVSTPAEDYAIIDGGTKTFPMDIMLDMPPYHYPGYALIEGRDDLQLRRMNEEHGIITSKTGKTGLRVGDIISMIPIHVCTAINMQNNVYLYDGERIIQNKVDARGMLV